mgnify:CR=1 FL=1
MTYYTSTHLCFCGFLIFRTTWFVNQSPLTPPLINIWIWQRLPSVINQSSCPNCHHSISLTLLNFHCLYRHKFVTSSLLLFTLWHESSLEWLQLRKNCFFIHSFNGSQIIFFCLHQEANFIDKYLTHVQAPQLLLDFFCVFAKYEIRYHYNYVACYRHTCYMWHKGFFVTL